jgi:hypothetical protein
MTADAHGNLIAAGNRAMETAFSMTSLKNFAMP